MRHPDMLSLDVRLRRAEREDVARLVLVRADADAAHAQVHDSLHPREAAEAAAMGSSAAQTHFSFGRFAAKAALAALRPSLQAHETEVGRGVFGQPVVLSPQAGGLAVSISHCGGLAAALAFPQGHPFGIDVEMIGAVEADAASALVSQRELAPNLPDQEAHARAWSAKECLGKILCCGLAAPASVFEIAGSREGAEPRTPGARWGGRFLTHDQYAFFTLRAGDHVFAMAHPARTHVEMDALRLTAFIAGGV